MSESSLLIQGGRVIDPGQNIDRTADLLVQDGVVKGIGEKISLPYTSTTVDASGLVVCPGFIDLHCHLREPGFEHKETIATAIAAATRGGFTTICAMPNTDPVMDSRAIVDFVLQKARDQGSVRVLPIGCVTRGSKGSELAEMGELAEAGSVGFSDDGMPITDPNIMHQALIYSLSLGLPIINHCEVLELSHGGSINEGWISNRLGLKGISNLAEDLMVARDISLAESTGGRLHIAHISTSGAVDLVRRAKEKGIAITCEATPHHLTLNDESVLGHRRLGEDSPFGPLGAGAYDTSAKVSPPLRARSDVASLIQGLKDGSVDFIATDHAPHGIVDKKCSFEDASKGISVLETALGSLMSLVHSGHISMPLLVEKLTWSPARFLDMDLGTLKNGAPADITIFDPHCEWVVDVEKFASKGRNTPLAGSTLKGKIMLTIAGGDVIFDGR